MKGLDRQQLRSDLARLDIFQMAVWKIPGSCWIWVGPQRGRYGQLSGMGAHRHSYFLAHPNTPYRVNILHKCNVPLCVNPEHLYSGTGSDNGLDRAAADKGFLRHTVTPAQIDPMELEARRKAFWIWRIGYDRRNRKAELNSQATIRNMRLLLKPPIKVQAKPHYDIVLTIPEAANRLNLSVTRLRSIVAEGRIPTQAIGPISVIRIEDLNAFAALERKPGRPKRDVTEKGERDGDATS